ncbi:MAG: Kdo2-lipid lauroyltransferase/acyltransferase [Alphaproteobacteria bacterium]|jgi:KDO2-lipid IV(A) lauroyltransferase|nr:Kdo2-lipid lauroyltransferase/acyltransferase [Alphaproteobacteria bacterium]
MARGRRRYHSWLRRLADSALGFLTVHMLRAIRLIDVGMMANFAGGTMRRIGPWLPEHRIGRANLAAAFPEKSAAEIEEILRGVWDNLGRVGAEFAHIDRLWDYDPSRRRRGRILDSDETEQIAIRLRDDGKPALVFAAHLANWELAAVGPHAYGIDSTVLYRRPNMPAISDAVIELRAGCMGTLIPTSMQAPFQLAEALQRGSHVAMLVDQYATQGVPVTFFGRRTRANALIARLARNIDCPIHGIRVVRYPGDRFQLIATEAIDAPRDAEGKIDVERTMQVITDVVEGWVREHPEQWLWLHRRWRDE